MSYQFKLDIFEGPLDLLLHLLKEQKMDIYDIPIATITKQYLAYVDMMQELNLELAGDYLLMAAELARIKSKLLLPTKEDDEDEEGGEDPRAELTRRLLEYQRYKSAAFELRLREHERQQMYSRGGEIVFDEEPEETMVDVSVFDLFNAFKKVVEQKRYQQDYEVKITTLSVSERIHHVMAKINECESITFESLFESLKTKAELIVTFLSILELVRMRLVRIQQVHHFEAIRLFRAADLETQEETLKDYRANESSPVQNQQGDS